MAYYDQKSYRASRVAWDGSLRLRTSQQTRGDDVTSLLLHIGEDSTVLDFENGQVKGALPEALGRLQSLEELYFGRNQILMVPLAVFSLKNLHILSLFSNDISVLPPEVGMLTNLRTLLLQDNMLTTLPLSLKKLQHLVLLRLDNNRLVEIPPRCLPISLEELYLHNNLLDFLPLSITRFSNSSLRILTLHNNPLGAVREDLRVAIREPRPRGPIERASSASTIRRKLRRDDLSSHRSNDKPVSPSRRDTIGASRWTELRENNPAQRADAASRHDSTLSAGGPASLMFSRAVNATARDEATQRRQGDRPPSRDPSSESHPPSLTSSCSSSSLPSSASSSLPEEEHPAQSSPSQSSTLPQSTSSPSPSPHLQSSPPPVAAPQHSFATATASTATPAPTPAPTSTSNLPSPRRRMVDSASRRPPPCPSLPSLSPGLDAEYNCLREMEEEELSNESVSWRSLFAHLAALKGTLNWPRQKLVVVGEEGVGKSSLMNELTRLSSEQGSTSTVGSSLALMSLCYSWAGRAPRDVATDGIHIQPWTASLPASSTTTSSSSSGGGGGGNRSSRSSSNSSGGSGTSRTPSKRRREDDDPERDAPCERKVIFQSYDFAGQEVYYPTHSLFISSRATYIVVFNLLSVGENASRLHYWLKLIQMYACEHRIILVGTHLDDPLCTTAYVDRIRRSLRRRFCERYPLIVDIATVSCTTRRGIDAVYRRILDMAQLRSVSARLRALPANFVYLEDMIKEMKKGQGASSDATTRCRSGAMTWTEFTALARICGISDATIPTNTGLPPQSEVSLVCSYLRDAGQLIYYMDPTMQQQPKHFHNNLSDFVVLDAQLLADVMSSIIGLKGSFVRDGLLQHQDATLIWPRVQPSLHPTLFTLLEYFGITYPLSSLSSGSLVSLRTPSPAASATSAATPSTVDGDGVRKGRSLVPCLLPANPPPNIDELWPPFTTTLQVGRVYYSPFLPIGMFGRLIVNILRLPSPCVAVAYWRLGIVLRRDGELAIARYYPSTHRLVVFVRDVPTARSPVTARLALARRGVTPLIASVGAEGHGPQRCLLRILLSCVDDLLKRWYPGSGGVQLIPCSHCLRSKEGRMLPYMFDVNDCTRAVTSGRSFVYCRGLRTRAVRLDVLAPDLCMTELDQFKVNMNNYVMHECVGTGGFATVYRATHKRTGRVVAIKQLDAMERLLLSTSLNCDEDEEVENNQNEVDSIRMTAFRDFQREVYAMRELTHPNVVSLLGISLSTPVSIILEFVPLGDLQTFIDDKCKPLPSLLKLRIARDMALGLKYLHSTTPPIIHRDLKALNILICSYDHLAPVVAKVGDFGLAAYVHAGPSMGERVVDNPYWLAPEIMMNGDYGTPSDVYSYAMILHQLYTRRFPFAEYEDRFESVPQWELEDAVVEGMRPTIRTEAEGNPDDDDIEGVNSTVPDAIAQIISDCWAGDPSARPTFADVVDRLTIIATKSKLPIHDATPRNATNAFDRVSQLIDHVKLEQLSGLSPQPRLKTSGSPLVPNSSTEPLSQQSTVAGVADVPLDSSATDVPTDLDRSGDELTPSFSPPLVLVDHQFQNTGPVQCLCVIDGDAHVWVGTGDVPGLIRVMAVTPSVGNTGSECFCASRGRMYTMFQLGNFVWSSSEDSCINVWDISTCELQKSVDLGNSASVWVNMGDHRGDIPSPSSFRSVTRTSDSSNSDRDRESGSKSNNLPPRNLSTSSYIRAMLVTLIPKKTTISDASPFSSPSPPGSFISQQAPSTTMDYTVGTSGTPHPDVVSAAAEHGLLVVVLACSARDQTVFMIDAVSLKVLRSKRLDSPPMCMVRRQSRVVVGTSDGTIVCLDIGDFRVVDSWNAHDGSVNAMVVVSHRLWSCSSDNSVKVWDMNSDGDKLVKVMEGHTSKVVCLCVVGSHVWSGSFDTSILIWDAVSLQFLHELRGQHFDTVRSIIHLGEGRVWSGGGDGTITAWKYLDYAPSDTRVGMHGWLTKQGQFRKNWKRRYFVLSPSGYLSYFVDPTCTTRKGGLSITCASIEVGGRRNNCITLTTEGRRLKVSVDDPEMYPAWLEAFRKFGDEV